MDHSSSKPSVRDSSGSGLPVRSFEELTSEGVSPKKASSFDLRARSFEELTNGAVRDVTGPRSSAPNKKSPSKSAVPFGPYLSAGGLALAAGLYVFLNRSTLDGQDFVEPLPVDPALSPAEQAYRNAVFVNSPQDLPDGTEGPLASLDSFTELALENYFDQLTKSDDGAVQTFGRKNWRLVPYAQLRQALPQVTPSQYWGFVLKNLQSVEQIADMVNHSHDVPFVSPKARGMYDEPFESISRGTTDCDGFSEMACDALRVLGKRNRSDFSPQVLAVSPSNPAADGPGHAICVFRDKGKAWFIDQGELAQFDNLTSNHLFEKIVRDTHGNFVTEAMASTGEAGYSWYVSSEDRRDLPNPQFHIFIPESEWTGLNAPIRMPRSFLDSGDTGVVVLSGPLAEDNFRRFFLEYSHGAVFSNGKIVQSK